MIASEPTKGKHLPIRRVLALFLRTMLWSVAALLIVFVTSCVISFNTKLRRTLYGPDHSASITLEPEKATISVELTSDSPIGKAEYERRLIVIASDGSQVVADLAYDHDGFASANLYRTTDQQFVLAGSFDAKLVSFASPRIADYKESYLSNRDKGLYGRVDLRDKPIKRENRQRFGDLVESNYFTGLFYVGAFQFQTIGTADGKWSRVWSFVPAAETEEFIRDPGG